LIVSKRKAVSMATMNISLPDQMRDWVELQIDSGLYSNNSDYVRDLIRKDQQRNHKIQAMQQAIDEGLQSGTPKPFNKQAFKTRMEESVKNA
tara:strand:- start:841 stop:1116 length:276 start_codon:yes stop_codon:yes gene_type:complete